MDDADQLEIIEGIIGQPGFWERPEHEVMPVIREHMRLLPSLDYKRPTDSPPD